MQIRVRGLSLALLVLLALPALALGDESHELTVQLSMYCPNDLSVCEVSPHVGAPGHPAAGHANFNAINEPWSFSFVTGDPLSWSCNGHGCENYNASFGVGGT